MIYWMVAAVISGKEVAVAQAITNLPAHRSFCPMSTEFKRPRRMRLKKGRFIEVRKPIFARYVFFCGDWDRVASLKYVKSVLRTGDQFSRIREEEIDAMRLLEKEGKLVYEEFMDHVINPGDEVEVTEGILSGQRGRFITKLDGPISLVEFDAAAGKMIEVQVPSGMLIRSDRGEED